jgi:hypothetical protein
MGNFPEKGLNVGISRVPQLNYLTTTTAEANAYVREQLKQRGLSTQTATEQDNANYATGNGFADDSWIEDWKSGFSYSVDLASQNIGRYLLAAMGKVTTTQPNAGTDPNVYKHVFTYLPFLTTSQLPSYQIIEQLLASANGINRRLPSAVAKSFKIASSGKAKLDGAIAWEGDGSRPSPSGVTWATHVNELQGTLNYFFAKQGEMIIADVGGANPVNVKCELKSSNFSIENEFAENDSGCPRFLNDNPKLGALRSHYLTINQKFMMDWVMKMRDNSPEHVALQNQTPFQLQEKWIGETISNAYKHQLTITSYLAKYSAVDDGFEDGMTIVNVKPNLLFNVAANKIVEVELINNVASYEV